MNKLPLALNDANQAIKLNPTWLKAYRRKASVLEAQKELDKAKGEEAEIKKLIQVIDKIAERPSYHQHLMKDTEITVEQRVMQEFERRCAAGEPMGS
ncbi:hypothetical protein B9Z19DRAFT_1131884 [Tuber borchii]|uniref:Uncharacterized protein n=1 Tax=Tuber borchii TaxID=42251 RepID=A0A2T6ZI95_TUBBO|nr:hypothetical protein B9Z19DRAFT_1131884 [Tuber borchii]